MKKMIILPMSFIVLLIGAVIIANASSCHGGNTSDEKDIEKDIEYGDVETDDDSDDINTYVPPVIPSFVQELGNGEWFADTICVVNGKVFYYASEDIGTKSVIYDDKKVWVADPTLHYDSFASGCNDKFYVSVIDKIRIIDFSKEQSLQSMSSLSLLLPSFTRYNKDSIAGFGRNVFYSFTCDFPKKTVPHDEAIRKWLVKKITDSQAMDEDVPEGNALLIDYKKRPNGGWKYRGDLYNHHQIAKFASGLYFALKKGEYGTNDEDYPSHLFSMLNLEAKVQNKRFVTYQQCTHDYNGGIHGYYTQRLISYDLEHKQEIDFNYLFSSQSKKQLLDVLLSVAESNPKYKSQGGNITGAVCITDENDNLTGELRFPQPGLSDEGVVFSFQPYEINCFAAGTFHFTIPYDKVRNLLTPRGKWCIGM